MTKQTESLAQAHGAAIAYVSYVDAARSATEFGFQFRNMKQREEFLRKATVTLPFCSWERRGKVNLVFVVNN